jgi:hypothetical protein
VVTWPLRWALSSGGREPTTIFRSLNFGSRSRSSVERYSFFVLVRSRGAFASQYCAAISAKRRLAPRSTVSSRAPSSHASNSSMRKRHRREPGKRRRGISPSRVNSCTVRTEHRSRAATSDVMRNGVVVAMWHLPSVFSLWAGRSQDFAAQQRKPMLARDDGFTRARPRPLRHALSAQHHRRRSCRRSVAEGIRPPPSVSRRLSKLPAAGRAIAGPRLNQAVRNERRAS